MAYKAQKVQKVMVQPIVSFFLAFLVFLTVNLGWNVVVYLRFQPRVFEYLCIVSLSCVGFVDSAIFSMHFGRAIMVY